MSETPTAENDGRAPFGTESIALGIMSSGVTASAEHVQPTRLTRAELDAMREAAEKDQRDPHGNDGVAMVRTVERILAARFAPVLALADDLAAWDLADMPVPDSVDVPDDYELGMNDAGAQLHAALRVVPPADGGTHE